MATKRTQRSNDQIVSDPLELPDVHIAGDRSAIDRWVKKVGTIPSDLEFIVSIAAVAAAFYVIELTRKDGKPVRLVITEPQADKRNG